ncbi:MFS transporter [Streptomyces roseifaciens]|uniref:MFS transporter n=1 Tax=Streptomyces roseifaciens TaxID=1488406 RepID=UPI001366128C|nr:MFS transporter [Streptomyces roseifaciens]
MSKSSPSGVSPPVRAGRIYYGWWLVAVMGVMTIVAYGTSQYLFGVLLNPVLDDLGGSRAGLSSAYSLSLVISAVLGIRVGRIVDRRGARAVLTAGCVVSALSLLGLAASHDLPSFYVVWSVGIGTSMALTLYPVTFIVVTNWFDRRRGSAMALLTTLGGLASPLFIPLVGWLIAHGSWRTSLVVLAVCQLAMAPVGALFVRRRPEDLGLRPDGVGDAAPAGDTAAPGGHSTREALGTPAFWCLTAAGCAGMLVAGALMVHQIPYMISRGMSPVTASTVAGITGLASIPARLVLNLLAERVESRHLLSLSLAVMALSTVVLCFARNTWAFVVFALLFGAGYGGFNPLRATALADQFGRSHFGGIQAWKNAAVLPFSAAGPTLVGYLIDINHTYLPGLLTIAAFAVLAVAASGFTPAPRPPRPLELRRSSALRR